MLIELPPMWPLPSASDRPNIEEYGGRRDGHGIVATSFRLGSPENPIVIDGDDEEDLSNQYHH
jgi:hypothetical protein